jgi:hypothetical protein
MTFSSIAFKIFKSNFRRYLLIFLCCTFSIMIFFTYMTLLTNPDFMDYHNVNSTISSNIIAPSFGVAIFCVFFVIYAHISFIKFRKTEYGMFMVLGMTNTDIGKIILIENSLIGIASLISGLLAGLGFSRIFYLVILNLIDAKSVRYTVDYKSFLYTAAFFMALYIIIFAYSFLSSLFYRIITLLKDSRREDKNFASHPVFAAFGLVLVCAAFSDMALDYKSNSNVVFIRSLIACFLGLYLLLSGFAWILRKLNGLNKNSYVKNTLFLSNLRYSFGQSKKILFVITILMCITMFFGALSMSLISASREFATLYSPYHMAYTEYWGINGVPQDTVERIINKGSTRLVEKKSIEYINYRVFTLLSDTDLNRNLGTDIHVKPGHFINLFQVVMGDGYTHDLKDIKSIELATSKGKYYLTSQGRLVKVLFNNIQIISPATVILNNTDYLIIKSGLKPNESGVIHLMNFENWRKTQGIVDELSTVLQRFNSENGKRYFEKAEDDVMFLKPVSRIGIYNEQIHSGSFLFFLVSFVGVLFFISSAVLLHFKLLTELDREKLKYRKLYKIGITDAEVSRVIKKELRVLFFLPCILAMGIAAAYSWFMPIQAGMRMLSACSALLQGVIFLAFQALYFQVYKHYYVRKFYFDSSHK